MRNATQGRARRSARAVQKAAALHLEPERYELHAPPIYNFKFPRRSFFKMMGCGLLVVALVKQAAAQESGRAGRRGGGGQRRPQELSAWIHIGEDGTITLFSGKAEVGQNVRTMLTQIVAEELRAPVASIKSVVGDTQLTPYDAGTFGSRSTPDMVPQIRKAAAAARELLLDLAAEQHKVDRASLTVADGKVKNTKTGETFGFGQITKGQKLVRAITDDVPQTNWKEWKVTGTSVAKVDGESFVTGKHKYASDVKLPNMLHAKMLRPPALRAKLQSLDAKDAEAIPGVTVVRDEDFIGVVAPDVLTAQRAAKALKAEWKTEPQISHKELFAELKKNAKPAAERPLADGEQRFNASYTIAYIAHAPLEQRAAVAEWKDDKLTVWTGTQRPFGVRSELAGAFKISENNVRVIMPDTGSGFGGKHTGEAAVEAARLAKAAGKPVKLVWSREEEFHWAYFRPAGVIDVAATVSGDGKITSWDCHNYNSGNSGIRMLYDVPGAKTEFHNANSPLRQGSYRALAATANHFARECAVDELAALAKLDPFEFRLKNLKDPRLRAVLQLAAEKFDWANRAEVGNGHGYGLAVGSEKNSVVATCVELMIPPNGKVQLLRVVQAFECGAVINPDHLKNQNEGCIVMGIGGALWERIEFANGEITNGRFADYRVPRFTDTPKIEVHLLDRKEVPSIGAGETPIVTIAPAIANAIFAATGKRLRSMPMAPNGGRIAA